MSVSSMSPQRLERGRSTMLDGMLVQVNEDTRKVSKPSEADTSDESGEPGDVDDYVRNLRISSVLSEPEEDATTSNSTQSIYGNPLDASEIKEIFKSCEGQDECGGLIWKALIVPADFDKKFEKSGKLTMLDKRHYDAENQCIKPRRGNLALTEIEFLSSLTHDSSAKNPRWFFSGVLNGWPGLNCLELLKIEYKTSLHTTILHWDSSKGGKPTYPRGQNIMTEVWAKLRSPAWSAHGWTKESPGYYYWHEGQSTIPRLTFGTNVMTTFEKDRWKSGHPYARCVKVHNIAHRYSVGSKEGIKNRLTYHSFSLLEWDHGKYCTVVELGFLNGLSGYNGKSNWIEDKHEPNNSMNKCFPYEMVAPWKDSLPELRCIDVSAKSLDEHLDFMKRHTGKQNRFLDVHVTFSHEVRLTYNSQKNIAQYLINYIRRERTYSEINNNCQTFTSDFSAFLAGKKDVQPYHPVNRVRYRNKTHYFLYDYSMYPSV